MPLLSIIVVTWNNEDFIEQALKSCIDASFNEYEVIVVHNASTDKTGELIARVTAQHKQLFRVIENARNEGLGPARNKGIKVARGKYLMFLDGDDWFEPGSIGKVANLLESRNPDVLLFNYQRVYDDGRVLISTSTKYLMDRDVSDPIERRSVMPVFWIACNKAYRRSFIIENGLEFPQGFYEDVTWGRETLMRAKSCYATRLIVFNYRSRQGSITQVENRRHFDILTQSRSLLKFFDSFPVYKNLYGCIVYNSVRSNLFYVFNVGYRIPRECRSAYLREMVSVIDLWRRHLGIRKTDWPLTVARVGLPGIYILARQLALLVRKLLKLKYNVRRQKQS